MLVFTAFLLAQQEDLRNRLIKLIGAKDIYYLGMEIDPDVLYCLYTVLHDLAGLH